MAHKSHAHKNSIQIKVDKIYKTTKDLNMARYDIKKGATFKVKRLGYDWKNHTELIILSGKIRTNTHSTFIKDSTKDYNGKLEFLSKEELNSKLGKIGETVVTFDPFNNRNKLPVEEISSSTKETE